jgi:hypothetical protein
MAKAIEEPALDIWLDFRDLQRAKIVSNWETLRHWQQDPAIKFPVGRLLGPNSRRWRKTEIDVWLASRPVCREVVVA